MPAVLSRAAAPLRSNARPAVTECLTIIARPSPFPTGPRASLVPRLLHTDPIPAPRLPAWAREEVKELIDGELKELRTVWWSRFESLSEKHVLMMELAATRHTEVMTKLVKSEAKVTQTAYTVCLGMVGLGAAAQYQADISKMLQKIVDGTTTGDPPVPPEVVTSAIKAELDIAKAEIPDIVKEALAEYFKPKEEAA